MILTVFAKSAAFSLKNPIASLFKFSPVVYVSFAILSIVEGEESEKIEDSWKGEMSLIGQGSDEFPSPVVRVMVMVRCRE